MRRSPRLPHLLLLGAVYGWLAVNASSAKAQVTTNPDALDSVAPAAAPPSEPPAGPAHAAQAAPHHAHPASHTTPAAEPAHAASTSAVPKDTVPSSAVSGAGSAGSQPASGTGMPGGAAQTGPVTPKKPPPPPTIPDAPPPVPVLTPPPVPVELHPFPMPPDRPAVKDAVGDSSPVNGGIRITFAPQSTDFNAETRDSVLAFVRALKDRPDTRAMIDATASGAPNDSSRPRRMALSRGLAVRAVLMNAGIPSTRIYVRVLGLPPAGDIGPADRVDIRRSDAVP